MPAEAGPVSVVPQPYGPFQMGGIGLPPGVAGLPKGRRSSRRQGVMPRISSAAVPHPQHPPRFSADRRSLLQKNRFNRKNQREQESVDGFPLLALRAWMDGEPSRGIGYIWVSMQARSASERSRDRRKLEELLDFSPQPGKARPHRVMAKKPPRRDFCRPGGTCRSRRRCVYEKHRIVRLFLGRHPSAGSYPALRAWRRAGPLQTHAHLRHEELHVVPDVAFRGRVPQQIRRVIGADDLRRLPGKPSLPQIPDRLVGLEKGLGSRRA